MTMKVATIVFATIVTAVAFMASMQQQVQALQWRTQEEIKAEYYQAMKEQFGPFECGTVTRLLANLQLT